ncbi:MULTISPECIES: Gfo/Idh/MocA family protein [Bradyrhizobium]|uniref:Gfo/Idh/MocA family protein n=1 Tax=Bradyrhizobium TaxID=374 RepID=UPI00155F287B|nr:MULTISPECIES: Gfo/Idh/MocA family oxidoreductase [Bradyrhizobium]MDD1523087.1 oxidoreductase [Bradyrhizobium sp. WBAH30]MDD1546671.1 oxidoreductase [Bradyrhizobium sp. WBAH41]MDD1560446.1 oxidoreductase [Bradyrhizobium sp. WBAH23]MDD1568276.1 oxidoreductase [Bradyrhizobium sp. WBAH33]MDD1593520.1 oxidoreductase [Bradyrhizobium sp. WBAH42]
MAIEASNETGGHRRIRLGMVGGGQGAFIGAVHRIAARIDDQFELVAGALASDPVRAKASAKELGIADDRAYGSFEEMARAEAARADGIEAVSIVTPNHMHSPVAKAFLEAGIHVICDKPLTTTLAEAEELVALVRKTGRIFVVTHNYTGYPMVRQARAMIANGELGEIRLVKVEYLQDWLTEPLETTGQKQAAWRTDPARSGAGGCIGDIGTHAYNLACFVTGLALDELLAQLSTFVEGRRLDDDVQILLRWKGGAKGMLWASQVAVGNENGLTLRVYGSKGGLEWAQENPNHLWFTPYGRPKQLLTRGGTGTLADAARVSRIPSGHPEGYLEGFATIYAEAARAIRAAQAGQKPDPEVIYPTVEDGLAGVQFIDAAVKSATSKGAWVRMT